MDISIKNRLVIK